MKNFNNIYKLLLVLPLIFMVSCDDSDDILQVLTSGTTTAQSTVFIETSDTHEVASYASVGVTNTLNVGVNNPASGDLTVSFSVTKDGGTAVEGVDYDVNDGVVSDTQSFGTGDITFLTVARFEVVVLSSSNSSLVVVDNKAIFVVAPPAIISIEWASSFYDYDHYLYVGNQDFDGELLANSFGVTAFETFTVGLPEGETSLFIDDWWGDNASIPVTLTVDFGGDISTFDVIMDMDKWVLVIDAGIDEDGDPALTFTDLN
jgi:hypothetical protein